MQKLAEFVPLEDVPRLQARCSAAKRDPCVLELEEEEVPLSVEPTAAPSPGTMSAVLDQRSLFPHTLLWQHEQDRTNNAKSGHFVQALDGSCCV
jgi:hypothetical protein